MTDYLDRDHDYRTPEFASVSDETSLWASRFGSLLLENVPLGNALTVLDLGCGTGFPLYELAHMLGPEARLWGADIWREGLARARSKQRVYALSNVAVAAADGAQLPFRDGSFELAVSNLGVNNFADAQAAFEECARVLAPGGILALTTNTEGHMAELYAVLRHQLEELGNPAYLERLDAHVRHRGTREGLLAMLRAAGLEPRRALGTSFTLRFASGGALLRHSLVRFGFLPAWKEVVDEPDRRRVFAELEHHLDHHAQHEGELRLTVPAVYVDALKA